MLERLFPMFSEPVCHLPMLRSLHLRPSDPALGWRLGWRQWDEMIQGLTNLTTWYPNLTDLYIWFEKQPVEALNFSPMEEPDRPSITGDRSVKLTRWRYIRSTSEAT